MHEGSIVSGLLRQIEAVAQAQGAVRVVRVCVKLGALSHLSPQHLRQHFSHAARGTMADGAHLDIECLQDTADPLAQDVLLHSIDVEG